MPEEIIKFLGGSTILIGAVAWLAKSIVNQGLSKDIAVFKTEIQQQSTIEVQKVSILHTKRAEVVAELYRLLIEFVGAAESYASPLEHGGEPNKDEKSKILGNVAAEFRKYFVTNRIYFSKDLCNAVDELWKEAIGPIRKFSMWRSMEGNFKETTEAWVQADETMTKKVPELLGKVEAEFRMLLGVESE